jgi:hypothetical protein
VADSTTLLFDPVITSMGNTMGVARPNDIFDPATTQQIAKTMRLIASMIASTVDLFMHHNDQQTA